jgi:hypothetical protein
MGKGGEPEIWGWGIDALEPLSFGQPGLVTMMEIWRCDMVLLDGFFAQPICNNITGISCSHRPYGSEPITSGI